MNVLVIPEDFRKDQYILKPIIEAMFQEIGWSTAKVEVSKELLGGIDEARKWDRIRAVLDRYRGMKDVFLLIVDRDGEEGRRDTLDRLEQKARASLPANRIFLAESAWQEVEVWVLAGHDLPKDWRWRDIRQERDAKEVYFDPFVRERGSVDAPYRGLKQLAMEAAKNYNRIRSRCSEDVASLEERLKSALDAQNSV